MTSKEQEEEEGEKEGDVEGEEEEGEEEAPREAVTTVFPQVLGMGEQCFQGGDRMPH